MPHDPRAELSRRQRILVLLVAFLGWLGAGLHMGITQQTGRVVAIDLLGRTGELDRARFEALAGASARSETEQQEIQATEVAIARWYAWNQCAFLFGAATGGLLFGWVGDRFGRARGMGLSILTYSTGTLVAGFVQAPGQFVAVWSLASLGVGGMWPNGVALVSEAWATFSRPAVAGLMGTAANVGIFLQATIGKQSPVTPDSWRWVMLIGAGPLLLGLVSLLIVPESPSWLRSQQPGTKKIANRPLAESVFRPPILWLTLIGIVLATTPVIGGWGTANWMMPWAEKVGGPELRSDVMQIRALTGIVGSFLGGWIANWLGRRTTYFVVSVASLAIAQYVFWMLVPTDSSFLTWVALLGFFSGIYFGWLPLCLPELFPTRVRSTGAGLSFNFGRIFTAITLFLSGALMQTFNGDYAAIGRVTSLCFGVGLVAIVLAPRLNPQSLIEEPLETQSQD